jgi:hypothetical protein
MPRKFHHSWRLSRDLSRERQVSGKELTNGRQVSGKEVVRDWPELQVLPQSEDCHFVDIQNATTTAFGKTVGLLGDFTTGKTLARDGTTELHDFADFWKRMASATKWWHVVPWCIQTAIPRPLHCTRRSSKWTPPTPWRVLCLWRTSRSCLSSSYRPSWSLGLCLWYLGNPRSWYWSPTTIKDSRRNRKINLQQH